MALAMPLSVSKKSGCAGLFRQKLKKCLRLGAQTPRPPGKAGRYELTLEGLRASEGRKKRASFQNQGFFKGLSGMALAMPLQIVERKVFTSP